MNKKCGPSAILLAYRDHLLRSFGLERAGVGVATFRIVLISRRAPFTRIMENEDKVLREMSAKGRSVAALNMESLPLLEQLAAVSAAQMLVGAHGAALFWLLVLGNCGTLFEFSTGNDGHYMRLAKFSGVRYRSVKALNHSSAKFAGDAARARKEAADAVEHFNACSPWVLAAAR